LLFERFEPLLIINQRSPIGISARSLRTVRFSTTANRSMNVIFPRRSNSNLAGNLKFEFRAITPAKKFPARTELKI
jgi:hypothetical protein